MDLCNGRNFRVRAREIAGIWLVAFPFFYFHVSIATVPSPSPQLPDVAAVKTYLLALQDNLCRALAEEDGGGQFATDEWTRPEGGAGRTRLLAEGAVFEKAGIAFSHV